MTTATGTRTVPQSRAEVWRALAVLEPYCAVCDVSYVVTGKAGKGTTFVCVPGRLEADRPPGEGAPRGEIVEWEPQKTVATRLELTPETWTTRIELADADVDADADATEGRGTAVTITVTHQPKGGSRLVRFVQKGATTRLVQHTVDSELAKLPEHLAQVNSPDGADPAS